MNEGKYSKDAVKMHTLIDLRGSIPAFISISDGRTHDSNVLDDIDTVPKAIYTMDKAYVDFEALARVKAIYKSPYSITEIGTLVRGYGLVKMDLGQLVTEPQPLILNQDVNELTLF